MADASFVPGVYKTDGGDKLVVASGGTLTIEAGGVLENANLGGAVGVRGGDTPAAGHVRAVKFDMDNTAGSVTWTNASGYAFHILTARVLKTDGNGTAGDSVQLKNATNAITEALTLNGVNDTTLTAFATIDDSKNAIADGGTLVCTTVADGDHCECEVSVVGMLV